MCIKRITLNTITIALLIGCGDQNPGGVNDIKKPVTSSDPLEFSSKHGGIVIENTWDENFFASKDELGTGKVEDEGNVSVGEDEILNIFNDIVEQVTVQDQETGKPEKTNQFIMIPKPGKIADIEFNNTGIARFSLNDPVNSFIIDGKKNGNIGEEYTLVLHNPSKEEMIYELVSIDDINPPVQSDGKTLINSGGTKALSIEAPRVTSKASQMILAGQKPGTKKSKALSSSTLAVGNELSFRVCVEFVVLNNSLVCGKHETITSVLHALGKYIAVYVDKDVPIDIPDPSNPYIDLGPNGLPLFDVPVPYSAGFSRYHLRRIAKIFDNNIYPLETSIYGKPPNIDGDQRISVLITPIVNSYRQDEGIFVQAYTNPQDLLPYDPIVNPTSNEQEVIYIHAPDPCGFYFPDKKVDTLSYSLTTLPAQLAIQLEKLISFNQHVLLSNSVEEEDWIDNGLGLLAADFSGFGGIIYTDLKMTFFDNPSATVNSLIKSNSPEVRGSFFNTQQYLFFKYLSDRFGTSLLKDLFGAKVGIANIENAVSSILPGTTFKDIFRDFAVAAAISDVKGVDNTTLINQEDKDRFQFKPILPSNRYGTVGFQTGIRIRGLNGSLDGDAVYDAFEDRNGNGTYESSGPDGKANTLDDELDSKQNDTDHDGFDDGVELTGLSSDYCRSLDLNANFLDFSYAKYDFLRPTSTFFDSLKLKALPDNYAGFNLYPGLWVYANEAIEGDGVEGSRGFPVFMDRDNDGLPDFQESAIYISPRMSCTHLLGHYTGNAQDARCVSPLFLSENADLNNSLRSIIRNTSQTNNPSEKVLRKVVYDDGDDLLENFNDNFAWNGEGIHDVVLDINKNGLIDNFEYAFLTILHEDLSGEGVCDSNEDLNFNGRCDYGIDFDGNGFLEESEIINSEADTIAKHRFISEAQCLLDLNYPANYTASTTPGDINGNGFADDLIYDLNANGKCDRGEDKNGDGIWSPLGLNTASNTQFDNETRIDLQDTDGDLWSDGTEISLGSDPNDLDSNLVDSDGDGLADVEEAVLGTSPLLVDSDGDGFDDNTEISQKTDPTDESDYPSVGNGEKVYVGNLIFRSVGAQVLKGPKEEYHVPGQVNAGLVAPYSIKYIRLTNLNEYQSNFIIKTKDPGLSATLIKQFPLCDKEQCLLDLGNGQTMATPNKPKSVFVEAKFGSLFQFPNTDRSLPQAERSGINAIDLSAGEATFIGWIDVDNKIDSTQNDLIKDGYEPATIYDVDKYVVDLPPMTRLAIWIDKRYIPDRESVQSNINPAIYMTRFGDVPLIGVPDDLRSGVAIPPFPPANSPFIAVPDPSQGPLFQYPQIISNYDAKMRVLHRVGPGSFNLNDVDISGNDADGDGLNNGDELLISRTNPREPDTDHDGYSDLLEFTTHTNPKNPEHNPRSIRHRFLDYPSQDVLIIPDPDETVFPPDIDEDEDFLLYSREDKNSNGTWDSDAGETCPNRFVIGCEDKNPKDTDGDGYSDGFEVLYGVSDPLKADEVPVDIDGDGLPNCFEEPNDYPTAEYNGIRCNPNPTAGGGDHVVGTYDDVLSLDLYTFDPSANETSAIDPDTDRDEISDGDEYFGVLVTRSPNVDPVVVYSDPLNPDTDGDGFSDGEEYRERSNATSIPAFNYLLALDLRKKNEARYTLPGVPARLREKDEEANITDSILIEQVVDCLRNPFVKNPSNCKKFDFRYDVDINTADLENDSYSIELSNFVGGQTTDNSLENGLLIVDVIYGGRFIILVANENVGSTGMYALHFKMLPHHSFKYLLQYHSIKILSK